MAWPGGRFCGTGDCKYALARASSEADAGRIGRAHTGGRGTLIGTLIGVALLGTIGTALTFLNINPFWEKAIQGLIILAALVSDVILGRLEAKRKLGAN